MKPENKKRLEEQLQLSSSSEYEKTKISDVSPGAVFVFDMPVDIPICWCSIYTHPKDSDLWFTVPSDEFQILGTKDIEVAKSESLGPLNLRCSLGVWIHVDDFKTSRLIGKIDEVYPDLVRERLVRLLDDDLPDVTYLQENDRDPDYLEWINELSNSVKQFQDDLHSEQQTTLLSFASMRTNWAEEVADYTSQSMALAADSEGLASIPEIEPVSSVGMELQTDYPGKLILVKYSDHLVLQVFGGIKSELPNAAANGESIEWEEVARKFVSSKISFVNQNELVIIIDGMKFVISQS